MTEIVDQDQANMVATLDTNAVVGVFVKIRDARAALSKKFDEEDKALKAKLEIIEGALLNFLNTNKMDSVRTDSGTFYRQEDLIPNGADWDKFYQWIAENGAFDALERRIKKTFISQYMEANAGSLPPGVDVFRKYVVRVRRS